MRVFRFRAPGGSATPLDVYLPEGGEAEISAEQWDAHVSSVEAAVRALSFVNQSIVLPHAGLIIPPGKALQADLRTIPSALVDTFDFPVPLLTYSLASETYEREYPRERSRGALDWLVNLGEKELKISNNFTESVKLRGLVWFPPIEGMYAEFVTGSELLAGRQPVRLHR